MVTSRDGLEERIDEDEVVAVVKVLTGDTAPVANNFSLFFL